MLPLPQFKGATRLLGMGKPRRPKPYDPNRPTEPQLRYGLAQEFVDQLRASIELYGPNDEDFVYTYEVDETIKFIHSPVFLHSVLELATSFLAVSHGIFPGGVAHGRLHVSYGCEYDRWMVEMRLPIRVDLQ